MKLDIETNPIALRSAFVAPTSGATAGGVCPQAGFRHVDDYTQGRFLVVRAAGMATGHRPWSPLIT